MIRTALQLLLVVLFSMPSMARPDKPKRIQTRIYTGPVIALYRNSDHYTVNSKSRFAINLGARFEYRLGAQATLGPALEYLTHGIRFNSYFFQPGQHALYDKSFPYTHTARLQELHVPFIFKYSLKRENDFPENAYGMVGFGYRYVFASRSSVVPAGGNGITWEDDIDARLEHSLFGGKIGAMVMTGAGAEKNFQVSKTSFYGELTYKFPLARWRYRTNGEAAAFYIKDSFITINVGYKF